MSDAEKLHFKITLGGTYWKKVPIYSISVNDQLLFNKEITSPSGEYELIEFDADVKEGPCTLNIRLENKDNNDVVKDDPNSTDFKIVNDLLLNIKNIEIDEIDLGNLIFTKSQFVGDDKDRPVLNTCIDLGWNGTWTLSFDSPFYIWLLENI
jgi:hypothetical protein